MYKNEREWLEAVYREDLAATIEILQQTVLPDIPPSAELSEIRRKLLTRQSSRPQWLSLLGRSAGALASITLLVLLVGIFWLNQANQAAPGPKEPDIAAGPVMETEPQVMVTATLSPTLVFTEATQADRETPIPTATAVPATDQIWWLAIRRQLTDRETNLTSYEIEVGYELKTVDTAVAQVFLAPSNWRTAAEMYPFSEPAVVTAEGDKVTFTIPKDLDQFFQELPPNANSLVVGLSAPNAEPLNTFLGTAAWKNFVDTEYFAGPILLAPASDSALNAFEWEFDNNFFAVESPPRRFSGPEIVTFTVNYHYQLTQTSRAYVKLVLVDKTQGNRRLDSAFVRADAGVGLITVYLEFDPAQVNGVTDLAIESYIVREGLESPDGTISGWRYTP